MPFRAAWPWVLCVIGLDYLSTLAYQPSIAFGAAGQDDGCSVVLLYGNGAMFCAGHDIKEDRGDSETVRRNAMLHLSRRSLHEEAWRCPKPIITAVRNEITALAKWRSSKEFDAREKAALALAEAVTAGRVSDRVYAEASKHFDHADYVELCLVGAFYAAVGRMIDALGVQLEPEMRDHSPRLSTK